MFGPCRRFLLAFPIVLFGGACVNVFADSPVRVTLSAAKRQLVLGEPLALNVAVKNTGDTRLLAFDVLVQDHPLCPEIITHLSRVVKGDEDFFEFVPRPCDNADVGREAFSLGPGEVRNYKVRPFYSASEPAQLAFSQTGQYRVKVEYPLLVARKRVWGPGALDAAASGPHESNIITIDIVKPTGVDAKVWETVNSPDFLYFLQWGAATKDHEEIPLQAAALLKSIPSSSYHAGLKWALKEYYHGYTSGENKLDEQEAELLRSVVEIEVPPKRPFPEDKRLDQIITYHFPQQTPMEEVFREISRQSGVSLNVDPSFQAATMASLRVTEPLRRFMKNRSAYKAEWVRQGDAYLLRAVEEPKQPKD